MTPHHHWFKSYTHFRTPVHLANNTVIYSAGVGNVVFESIVNGKPLRAVEFSQVLHVPDLRSNLLSCLYLACYKGITINISSHTMAFRQGRKTLFTASIDSSNLATLDGSTVTSEVALAVSTLLANLSLWHCCFFFLFYIINLLHGARSQSVVNYLQQVVYKVLRKKSLPSQTERYNCIRAEI